MTRIGFGTAAPLIDIGTPHLATTALALLWIGAAALALLSPGSRRLGQVSP